MDLREFFSRTSRAAPTRFVFHVVENLANYVHSDAAGPDVFEISAAYAPLDRTSAHSHVKQRHAVAQTFISSRTAFHCGRKRGG